LSTPADPKIILVELVTAIANTLKVDRCFLYVRDPQTRLAQVACCFCRNPRVPDVSSNQWQETVYVEDLEASTTRIKATTHSA
jgi:hypothetical protein